MIIEQMMRNPNLANNQLARNAYEMYKSGNTKGLNEMMSNLCKERGVKIEDIEKQIKSMFGI
jgi:hypothetical protein